jgi:hypothetical protein
MSATEVMSMGKIFYASGCFKDTGSVEQAIIKIQAGQELGIPPFAAMSGIHLIKGKPVVGAGIIASRVKASGKYDYEVLQLDNEICELEFFSKGKSVGKSVFTMEDAKKAGTGAAEAYAGAGKNIVKFTRNMLFARAISNGVKWYCPDVFLGPVYTPEEMEGLEDPQPGAKVTELPPKKKKSQVIEEDLQEVVTVQEWSDVVAKWIKKDPQLEGNGWFQDITKKYYPENTEGEAEPEIVDGEFTEDTVKALP